jgi:hypothetical protein
MKTALSSAVIAAAAIAALVQASPAAATPDTPSADTACGTTLESWVYYALEGAQWHGDPNTGSPRATKIDIRSDGVANWNVETVGYAAGVDRVWIESNSARFRSDMGRGWGDMIDFTVHTPTCDAAGNVVSAHATTYVPVLGGVFTIRTYPDMPLKAV